MKKRFALVAVSLVLSVAAMISVQFATPALPTAAWGLSFEGEHQAPRGPATAQELKTYDAAYVGDQSRRVLYLTFDAGYENGCTAQILDVLQKHHVKATFFLVGDYIKRNQDLVRRMVDEGHVVGNHTMHHRDMSLEEKDAFFWRSRARSCPSITGRPRASTAKKTCAWPKAWAIRPYFGAWPMWIG